MEEVSYRKRVRVDPAEPDFDQNSTKAKKFKDDLLSILDDPEPVPDPNHDLDSVIRSFEEEITRSESSQTNDDIIDLTAESGDFASEFGQFDDGVLPENEIGVAELSRIGELWNFEDELTSFDSFGVGLGCEQVHESNEYVALDGIFDYSDNVNFGSDFLWRSDTLPAL
ncbi:Myosin-2 [Bienertia sinuspersici]